MTPAWDWQGTGFSTAWFLMGREDLAFESVFSTYPAPLVGPALGFAARLPRPPRWLPRAPIGRAGFPSDRPPPLPLDPGFLMPSSTVADSAPDFRA